MKQNIQKEHNDIVIEQFSKQAVPFTKIKGHYDSVETIISMSEVSKNDTVLDIACGTGIVACVFAKYAKNVIGLDITQDMLNQAIKTKNENHLKNIEFDLGNVEHLPYKGNSFDIVCTRYSFHHFLNTKQVFNEMIRVCKSNGKVIVIDVALKSQDAEAYNYIETLRDPSHTKALTFDEFNNLLSNKILTNHKQSSYNVDLELENLLDSSFPNNGDRKKLYKIYEDDLNKNKLGMNTSLKEGKIYITFPITIFMADKISKTQRQVQTMN